MNPAQAYRLFLRKRGKDRLTHCATGSYNDVQAGSSLSLMPYRVPAIPYSAPLQAICRALLYAVVYSVLGCFSLVPFALPFFAFLAAVGRIPMGVLRSLLAFEHLPAPLASAFPPRCVIR